jgi:V/A-type H+-transporting ATPase subunit I
VLSPEPMRYLTLVVLATELEAVTRAVARVGVLHLLDVRRSVEPLADIRPCDVDELVTRLDALSRPIDAALRALGLPPPEPQPSADTAEPPDLQVVADRASPLLAEVDTLRARLARVTDEGEQLRDLLRNARALAPLGTPIDRLRELRYAHFASGLLPARSLMRLRESLARIPHVVLPAGSAGADGRILVTALCLRRDREVLDRALHSAQLQFVELPARFDGTPEAVTAQIEAELAANREALAGVEAERRALASRIGPELSTLRLLIERERLLAEARGWMGRSDRTAIVSGWVPAVLAPALEEAVRTTTAGRCVVRWANPAAVEGVRGGRIPVPILLHNPVLIRPFEGLLRSYGLPRYGEVEPTAVVAVAFLTMFGFMFGDVGQGAVLFAIGYFIYRRMFRYRDYAVILMECGVFATFFGFLYGSVFGSERWLPALWLRPMQDVGRLIETAIGFGIGFISLGLGLNLVNAIRRRDAAALWERNGLLAALAYWIAVGLLVRHLTGGPGSVTLGTAMLWLSLPAALILLKEPARAVLAGLREHRWPGPGETFALIVESFVELLDTIVSTVSNTATFIRLAAFAISHAGLFLATFSIAEAVSRSGSAAGTAGAAAVLVLGNMVIIGLEGMIVAIQSVRLEYYEFFSKFYSGGGEEYRPLHLGATRSARA